MGKTMVRGALLLVASAAMLIPTTAANASGGSDAVIDRGSCSGSSTFKLKASREDAGIEVQFEIEGRAGQTFRVRLLDNGDRVFGARRTANSVGELRVRRVIDNRAGADHIVARARNAATGETCVGSVTI